MDWRKLEAEILDVARAAGFELTEDAGDKLIDVQEERYINVTEFAKELNKRIRNIK